MEKQDSTRITRRKLGIDSYIVCDKYLDLYLEANACYRINKLSGDRYIYLPITSKYVYPKCNFRKATKQEYIVAKLKGKLYE